MFFSLPSLVACCVIALKQHFSCDKKACDNEHIPLVYGELCNYGLVVEIFKFITSEKK